MLLCRQPCDLVARVSRIPSPLERLLSLQIQDQFESRIHVGHQLLPILKHGRLTSFLLGISIGTPSPHPPT